MIHDDEIYEVPTLVEVGEFTELTLGIPFGFGCPDYMHMLTPYAC
nr:lasso RiPP family leader peptide-containing protein [Kibdelosporangium sp. MJ126-NF4]CEL12831.1 hypothetical protein [Kibdelosporangium sp. MJ126-NF4]CTQ98517.1 hypothetical protein [Kibdelosporangium sp. MJ126-NF4]